MSNWREPPGFGDEETWGRPTGHPLDPRTDDSFIYQLEAAWSDKEEIQKNFDDIFDLALEELAAEDLSGESLDKLSESISSAMAGEDAPENLQQIGRIILSLFESARDRAISEHKLPNGEEI